MSNSTQVQVNESLVEFDNLLRALNMLYEEIQTRKETIVQAVDIEDKVHRKMETSEFRQNLLHYIRNEYGQGLYREIAIMVMEEIDKDIQAFINHRVNEALQAAGVQVNQAAS